VPAASIWAIPEDVDLKDPEVQQSSRRWRASWTCRCAPDGEADVEDKTFVWVKRQLDWDVGQKIVALNIKGIYNRKEYKRQYPEGESRRISWASPMWKTMVRKAWSWRSTRN
jgi:cell division protein FtsI (penicillin-binding protein 3)